MGDSCGGLDTVFFDLVGTLVRPSEPVGVQYAAVARAHGVAADPVQLDLAFREVFASTPPAIWPGMPPDDVRRCERQHWHELVAATFERAGYGSAWTRSAFDACFQELFSRFAGGEGWTLYPDARPSLSRLRRQGLRLGLVTNFDMRVFTLLDNLGLGSHFDVVAVPGVTGAAKPDPRVFDFALASCRTSADRAVHVGDSVDEDVVGARRAGLRAVLLDRKKRCVGVPGVDRIETLDDLRHGF